VLLVVTPTPPDSPNGNGVTARRWAAILRELGHHVAITQQYRSQDYHPGRYQALIALHAVKSAAAVRSFHADHPRAPIVIGLTGTDLYPSLDQTGVDPAVLALASRIVVLQPDGINQVPSPLRARTQAIFQSMPAIALAPPRPDCFEVAFLAHVRPVKDPLLLAGAVGYLPAGSRVKVTHAGEGRDPELAVRLTAAAAATGRYDWLGPLPREQALEILARSRLLAVTSVHEGGANVVTEALALGVPVVSSAIPGSIGILGPDYPGYFRPGDARDLARLLSAAEVDHEGCYQALRERCAALRPLADPARERDAWAGLMAGIGVAP
jgi:putative glycosyltransferase (TIGR04348 family)